MSNPPTAGKLPAVSAGDRVFAGVWLTLLAISLRVALQVFVDYTAESLRAEILWENALEHVALATPRAWILVVVLVLFPPRPWLSRVVRFLLCAAVVVVILSGLPDGEIEYLPSWDSPRGRLGWAAIALLGGATALLDAWMSSHGSWMQRQTLAARFLVTALILVLGGGSIVALSQVLEFHRYNVVVERTLLDGLQEWARGRARLLEGTDPASVRLGSIRQTGQKGSNLTTVPALVVTPDCALEMRVTPKGNSEFLFSCAVEPAAESTAADHPPSGAVEFLIEIEGRSVWKRTLHLDGQAASVEASVDLTPQDGKEIGLVLRARADESSRAAVKAGFGRPRVVRSERTVRHPVESDHWNVLLVVVNCLRADHVGCYGYARDTTPCLDELAKESLVYTHAYSPASWTAPAMASILTGDYPPGHRVLAADRLFLSDALRTLPEVLREKGISTGGWSTHALISRSRNFQQGFEVWRDFQWKPGSRVTREFKEWVQRYADYQFFAMLHYADPHHPYYSQNSGIRRRFVPKDSASGVNLEFVRKARARALGTEQEFPTTQQLSDLVALYDAEIATTDHEIRKVFDELKSRGLWEKTIVIVTGDHGEEFMDHGGLYHGWTLHQELTHVPLIVRHPSRPAQRIDELVSLTQIPATVMRCFDLAPQGLGTLSVVELPPWGKAPGVVYAHTAEGIHAGEEAVEWAAARTENLLLLQGPRVPLLYDLTKDSKELTDVSALRPEDVALWSRKLEVWRESFASDALDLRADSLDETTRQLVQFLGYSTYLRRPDAAKAGQPTKNGGPPVPLPKSH